jgi:hypothetical protein
VRKGPASVVETLSRCVRSSHLSTCKCLSPTRVRESLFLGASFKADSMSKFSVAVVLALIASVAAQMGSGRRQRDREAVMVKEVLWHTCCWLLSHVFTESGL